MKIFSLVGLMAIFMWGNLSAQTTVAAVTPAKNALNVSAATTIQATFSAAMLASSFNDTASFIVSGMTSGRHRGTIVLSSGNTVATFTTTVAFATGEIVTVDLTSNLMNAGSAAITPLVYTFTVKTNPGSGTFAASVEYPVGLGAEDVFISDLDGDGDGDLVVAIRDDSDVDSISVLKNNGDGTFAARVVYATGNNEPGSLFVNDLDGDGDGDIVVTNHGTALVFPSVSILENNGDGTFAANVDYGTGERPTSVFMSDIDGDGDGDIVVANELDNDISILKNNGNGTFATKVDYAAGVSPIKIFMSDVDGDGDGDIAVTNKLDDDVSILMNNGDGTFSAKVDYATGDNPISVFIYDLDGDLDGDIAVECTDSVSILENNGDGTFASKVNYATGGAYGFFINDVDGDGDGDIAAVNDGTNTVSILKNHGDGTFAVKANYIIGGSLNLYFGMYISDVDGDDIADIVIVNSVSNAVFILKGLPGPSVTTENSANFAVNSATANGTVNANNASTTVRFLYGIVSGIYTDSVTAAQSPVSGLTNTPVSAVLSGLDSNTTYYFLVAASNTDGYVRGGELSFTTTGGPPSATTNAASNIGLVTATVNGSVNADDISTTVRFVYGNVSGVYTDSVTATPSPVNGTTDTPVSASLSGLSPNTTYFFRVAASNAGGYVRGGESNFTTTSSAVPTATTNAASNIGVATARANGTVNAGNASTTVRFLYGTISGVYADSVTATQSPVSGTVNTSVTGSLSPLDSNTTYYFIVAASNGNGYVRGTELSFTTDSIGSSGYALHFDGTDYVAANLVTTVTNNLTMEGWVKWDGGNAVNQLLIYNGNSGNNGYGIVLNPFTLPDSNLGILCGGVAYLTTSTTFTIGVWHHVAAVRSAGIWKLYLDGVQLTLTNTGTVPNTPATTGTNMGQNSFAGTLDEIRVWNVARTESEIQTTMNQSLNGAETGLVAYWSVEEGTGPTTADITVNGNDGTINGATWVSSITALPAGPSATTSNASNIGVGTARANGIVYANNASTTVRFVYGTISGTYTDSVTATQSPVTGTTNTSVSKSLSGLSANTMYFFRVVASNTNGYVRGNELSFTTNNTGSSSGYALQFDGVDDYVEIGNASAFSVGSAVTYEAWINPSSTQLGWILNKWVDFIEDKQLLYSGNRVFFYLHNTFGGSQLVSSLIPLNQYTHIAATYNGSIAKLYINGVLDTTKSVSSGVSNSIGSLYIGYNAVRNGGGGYPFQGLIDEVRVWNVARTESEIQATMNLPLNGNETGLVAYWNFDEGSGSTTADITSNGNDGSVSGASWIVSAVALPVELTSFTAVVKGRGVELLWKTATEVNNYGFEIERRAVDERHLQGDGHLTWMKTGFVEGNGTTNSPKQYSFTDKNLSSGKYLYRLKQIDRDGKFTYSQILEVNVATPMVFELKQNYPNPFNPTTTINYQLPMSSHVSLKVYDAIGREVATLVNEVKDAGSYSASFNASDLSSGIYFASLRSSNISIIKKMTLLK